MASPIPEHNLRIRAALWTAAAYLVVAPTVANAFLLVRYYRREGLSLSIGRALLWQAIVYGTWAIAAPVVRWAAVRWRIAAWRDVPWLAWLPAYVACGVVLVPAHALLASWIAWAWRPGAGGWSPFASVAADLLLDRLPIDLLLYWGIVAVVHTIEVTRESRARERAAAALEADLARARLHALGAQLRPHFLFNALQSIAALVRRDPDAASAMIVELGALLRHTLGRTGAHLVALHDEIELVRRYLRLEEMRFGERLRVVYDVPDDLHDCLVPDLVLQPLAENALRHGLASRPEGGTVTIGARRERDRLVLTVADDGVGLGASLAARADEGVGLRNTRERLRHLYGAEGSLTLLPNARGRGAVARVELPAGWSGSTPVARAP